MGFTLEVGVSAFAVFLQGLLSFFSPCVLPLVPLYISYLAGGTKTVHEDGSITYKRSKVMVNTICFVIGISFAFFLLGFGFSSAGRFFGDNRNLLAKIGGILIIVFGLVQLGVFGKVKFQKEHRFSFFANTLAMNPFLAFLMGFTFSFAWTPCVGPTLASVLIMASSASTASTGFLLIGVYTFGFVILFLAVGLFTGSMLTFFRKNQRLVQYTVKIGGVLMIVMGVMMLTGWMNGVTGYLSRLIPNNGVTNERPVVPETSTIVSGETSQTEAVAEEPRLTKASDFTLTDQYGNTHTLSDYKGKVVFLNFWATWCGPCRQEMPDIQKVYEEYGWNQEDVIVLGVANPKSEKHPYNQDIVQEEIVAFLEEGGYSYPVAMDVTGEVFSEYYISAIPTTFMIDVDGNIYGYVPGTLTKEMMDSIILQTIEG